MRKLILGVAIATSTLLARDINVEVTNLLNTNGYVQIGLYNNAQNFSIVDKVYKGSSVSVSSKTIQYKFKNIPNGTYAISIFHDENENKKLDTNFFGIPSEGYGSSNNIRPSFRGANFDEAKFELDVDKNIIINMGY